ncbi:MAG: S9 family peptidase [Phycisphaerales bacterium]|nr:S9 family peptidase [Phycisphaerales bacterium]NNM27263.1 S9 family peptidase [Phycisphaerales bacterium]
MPPATATRRRPAAKSAPRQRRVSGRAPVTPEDLHELVFVGDPQMSPDGSTVLFGHKRIGEKNEYERNLWIAPLDGAEPRPFTTGGRDGHGRFSPDGERVAFIRATDKHQPQIYVIDVAGGEARQLTSFDEGSIRDFKWSPTGEELVVSFRPCDPEWTQDAKKQREAEGLGDPPRVVDHWWYRLDGDGYFNGERHHLYRVDAETGVATMLYGKDTLGGAMFDFSPDGKELVISTNRERRAGFGPWNDELLRLDLKSGKLTPIPNLPRGPKNEPRYSPDGKQIAYAGREGEDDIYSTENLELWVCDAKRGKARSLTGKTDYCLMAVTLTDTSEASFGPVFRWDPDGKRIYMQVGWHGETHVASVRTDGTRFAFHTEGAATHQLGTLSDDGKRLALTVATPARPDEVAVLEVRRRDADVERLTGFNDAFLAQRTIANARSHWVKTADGTKVQVWVMLPPNPPRNRRLPAVLQIHGGPHAQYGMGFFHEFQVLASAGYAVFFSNPRGSKGYGRDHCHAIRGSWGGADWVDIQAVTAYMQSHPVVDPKRMGVMGGSYGGYMTNWVIGHCHDFAGAITDRCVSNLVSMAGNSDYIDPPDLYFPGNAWDRPEARWQSSPLRMLGNCKTPTLIIHSEGDLRCNVEQAEQVFHVLLHQKVPTRFVRYPRSTSHGMSRGGPPDMRRHRLQQILAWWTKYLK